MPTVFGLADSIVVDFGDNTYTTFFPTTTPGGQFLATFDHLYLNNALSPVSYNVLIVGYNDCGTDTFSTIFSCGPADVMGFVYPNPASEILNLDLNAINYNIKDIKIYNSLGILEESIVGHDTKNLSIDLKDYSSGLYFLKITHEHGANTTKFIKQ